jgi:hypothetical protein
MHTKLAVAVGILVVGAGAHLWPRETHEPPVELEAPVSTADATELSAPSTSENREAVLAAEPEQVTAPADLVEASAQEPSDGRVEVSGTLAVFADGVLDHPTPTGEVRFLELTPDGRSWIQLEVMKGLWSARLYPGSELSRPQITVAEDTRMAVCRTASLIVPEDGSPLAIEARWIPDSMLRVVDARTGRDLSGVEVRVRTSWRAIGKDEIPGEHENVSLVLEGAASPILLPPLTTRHRTYWVRAAGYAWGRVFFDNQTGGERRIELVPASAVRIVTVGEVPEGAWLRLRRLHRAPFHDGEVLPQPGGETRVEGLRSGTYTVTLELGSFQRTTPLGSAAVELVEGQESSVELVVDGAALDQPLASLAGTLRIPEGHAYDHYRLHFQFVSSDTLRSQGDVRMNEWDVDENDPGLVHWRAADVVPGSYDVYVPPVYHRVKLSVPLAGIEDFHIELPPAATARISFVDRQTRATVRPQSVHWMDGKIDGIPRNMQLDARWNSDQKCYLVETVAGEVDVDLRDTSYGNPTFTLELAPGVQTVELELDPTQSITVSFFEGDAQLAQVDSDLFWDIHLTGPATSPGGTSNGHSRTFFVPEPGTYELTFPDLPGFESVPPRRVDVGAGEAARVEVQLVRKEGE